MCVRMHVFMPTSKSPHKRHLVGHLDDICFVFKQNKNENRRDKNECFFE